MTPARHNRETTEKTPKKHQETIGTTEAPSRHHRDTTESPLSHHRVNTRTHPAQAGSREPDGACRPLELTAPSYRYIGGFRIHNTDLPLLSYGQRLPKSPINEKAETVFYELVQ